jgi:hypothetical protein
VALLVLTTVIAGAGTMCLLPAASVQPSATGCHPVPHSSHSSHPQPADYRCCVSRHPAALVTTFFSPRPAMQPCPADAIDLLLTAIESDSVPPTIAASGGPPGAFILRV